MKQNGKSALALMLAAALLTLSGCDGAQDGTIDYIDGHWVFTDAQSEQHMDVTQLLSSPDAFYAAAGAMSDEALRASFDRLTSGQCAELFRALGEERAMALAGRLTQPQVERLLTALQGQERVQSLSDPAALAAVWPTLTTDEQLMALSNLSSEEYAALWALLDAATPTPDPEPVQPETTDAPDMTDPVYLAGIWHELSQQEQSDILSGLSSAQFVALWSLLDAQGSASSAEATPAPSDGGTDAQQTTAPQTPEPQTPAPQTPEESAELPAETAHDSEGAQAQASDSSPTPSPDTEQAPIALPTDPAALAEVWFTLSPEEQLSAVAALTADQFVSLQELLSTRPRPTPAEEDELFIPTPRPTARRTPRPTPTPTPTPAPTAPPDEAEAGTPEPDLSNPAYLASIWHTLSPQEQLSILSTLTVEQYTALQELLAKMTDGTTEDAEQAGDKAPEEKTDESNKTDGDGLTSEEEPGEKPDESGIADGDGLTSEEEPGEKPDESGIADGDGLTSEEDPEEKPDESDVDADNLNTPEDGATQSPDASGQLPPGLIAQPGGEATPSEALSIPGQSDSIQEPLAALSMILKKPKP